MAFRNCSFSRGVLKEIHGEAYMKLSLSRQNAYYLFIFFATPHIITCEEFLMTECKKKCKYSVSEVAKLTWSIFFSPPVLMHGGLL